MVHPFLIEEISKHKERLVTVFSEDEEKLLMDDKDLIWGYLDMLEMGISNDDYDTADYVCEELQNYKYPENVSKHMEKLFEKVNNLDSDAVIELINIIKDNLLQRGKWGDNE